MKTLRKTTLALSIALAAASAAFPAAAGTVAGFGGSTEFTQLANNVQLGMSYVEQVETALNSARQYKLMIDQVRRNPGDFAKGMLGGTLDEHLARADDVNRLVDSLESLNSRSREITDEWARAQLAIENLGSQGINMPPEAYYAGMAEVARQRGGAYQERIDRYQDNLAGASDDVERVNKIVAQSEGMTTQIQGLQNVVASNGVIASLLMRQIQIASEEAALESADSSDSAEREAAAIERAQALEERSVRALERELGIVVDGPAE